MVKPNIDSPIIPIPIIKRVKRFHLLPNFWKIFSIVLVWRICLEFINQFVVPLVDRYGNISSLIDGLSRWRAWDGEWYFGIITTGYHYSSSIATSVPQNVAFFPGFPAIVRLVHNISRLPYLYAGLLSNFLLTVGIVYIACELYAIFVEKYTSKINKPESKLTNFWPAIIVLSLPTTFIFAAFYADALLVFCLMLAIYLGLKKRYILAAVFAGFASGVNPIGVIAAPALLLMFIEQESLLAKLANSFVGTVKKYTLKTLTMSILSINGILIYMLYLWHRFSNPLAFYKVEKAWGRASSSSFFSNLSYIWRIYYAHLFNLSYFGNYRFELLISLSDMLIPILAIVIIVISIYKKAWWLAIYSLLLILVPISTGTLVSLNRYALGLIPALIFIFALASKKRQKYAWIIVSLTAVTEIIFTVIFLQNFILYLVG